MKKIKIILLLICVVGFMSLIFYFSSQSGMESHKLSRGITTRIMDLSPMTRVNRTSDIVKYINFDFLIRKTVHFFEYFILSILLYTLVVSLGIHEKKSRIIAILVCMVYSITDEIHQAFVRGRTPLATDSLIDILGSVTAMLVLYWIINRKNKLIKIKT